MKQEEEEELNAEQDEIDAKEVEEFHAAEREYGDDGEMTNK